MSKIKNGGWNQYGPEWSGRLIFATIRKDVVMKRLTPQENEYNYLVYIRKLDSLHWFSQRHSRMPHFLGCASRGLWSPNSNSAEIFIECTYPPHVSSSYVYSFGRYRIDKQTNKHTDKQTPLKTSNAIRYATTLGKHKLNLLRDAQFSASLKILSVFTAHYRYCTSLYFENGLTGQVAQLWQRDRASSAISKKRG